MHATLIFDTDAFDSILRTPEENESSSAQDSGVGDNGGMSSGDSPDRIPAQHSIPMNSTCAFQSSSSSSESVMSPHPGQQVSRQEQLPPVAKKRRFSRLGENLDGSQKFRLIVKSCRKKVLLRRLQATKDLDDDFYIPDRAKLILDFLQNHGDRMVRERNGPRQSFSSTLTLVQHVMQSSVARSSQAE